MVFIALQGLVELPDLRARRLNGLALVLPIGNDLVNVMCDLSKSNQSVQIQRASM